MSHFLVRRLGGATVLAVIAGVAAASPAAAQARCEAPDNPGWRSCLSVSHRAVDGGPQLLLTKARPRLVERLDRCPAQRIARRAVVRTSGGKRLGAATVRSRCSNGIARWVAVVELNTSAREGTVIRSFWSGIDDSETTAPRVKLEASEG